MTTKVSWESDNKEGRYVRADRTIHNKVGEDERFPAENGRYHLYVSHACPCEFLECIQIRLVA